MLKIKQVENFKNSIKFSQKEPEIISNEAFIRAKANIDTMCINNREDAFLYYSSLNLLNTYVKQNKNVSYYFKSCVTSAFDSIIENNLDASFYYDTNEHLLIINIMGLQFSFHYVKLSAKMNFAKNFKNKLSKEYYKPQNWEGIRLQPVAESLFNFANNLEGLSNQSIAGNLKDYQEECIKNSLKNSK